MKLEFLKCRKTESGISVDTLHSVSIKTEREGIKKATNGALPEGTTAVKLINEKTSREGWLYKYGEKVSVDWWEGHNWSHHYNAFSKKN